MKKTLLFLFAILSVAVHTSRAAVTDTVGFQVLPFRWTCIDTVRVQNLSYGATSYEWDFGDTVIVTSDTSLISHVYEFSGTYTISLTAIRGNVIVGTASEVVTVNGRYVDEIYDSVDCRHPYVALNDSFYLYPCDTLFWIRQGRCFRAYKLHLGHITTHYTITRMLCGGESLCICDTCISTGGKYHLSVVSPDGCDSIVDLTVYSDSARVTERLDPCRGDQVVINGRTFTESTVFIDTLRTSCGGDSIVEHIINFHDATRDIITRKICPGDSVEYDSVFYTSQNNYVFRHKSIYGCDSVVILQVQYFDHYYKSDSVVVTDSVYLWEGQEITRSGNYYRYYKTIEGCDSTLELYIYFDRPERTYVYQRICTGEISNFNGRTLTQTGVYVDTLRTAAGDQDSIVTLNLHVFTTIYDTLVMNMCGDSYTFHGNTYDRSGEYDISVPYTAKSPADKLNCDSISYHLSLSLCNHYRHIDNHAFSCDSMTYYWPVNGFTYTPCSDTVTVHYTSVCGCDSDYILMMGPEYSYRTLSICQGQTVIIHGDTITQPGVYSFMLKSVCQLDSAEVIEVVEEPIIHSYDSVTICDGESYFFYGKYYSVAGDYTDTFPPNDDCPEYHHLHLEVRDTFYTVETVEICVDSAFVWHGKTITTSGHYFARFQSVSGCDSIYEGFITIHRKKKTNISAQICQGDSCQLGRRWYRKTGIYYDTLLTSGGCDSIVRLVLNVMPEYFFPTRDTFCQGSQYNFRGQILSHGGIYYDSLTTAAGCDSIYMLDLVMLSPSHIIEYVTECKRTTYPWHGRYLTQSGSYFDTLTNALGCDSVIELRLTIHKPAFTSTFATICRGDSILFGTRHVSHTGRFYDTLRTTHGCDSVIELCLNVQSKALSLITANICYGDVYNFNGRYLTDAGTYYDTLMTIYGCDSIIKLVLQKTPVGIVTDQNVFLCDGDSFSFRGHTFTGGEIFYDTLMTTHGCDSVVKYIFTVGTTMHDYKNASICQGDYYSFHGRKLNVSGSFSHIVRDPVSGCVTDVYHINLTVLPSYHFYEHDTICDNQTLIWHNQNITKSGVYTDSNVAVNGCDSVYQLDIVVNHIQFVELHASICSGQSVNINGRVYSQPGIYCDTTLNSQGCDSITKLVITQQPEYLFSDTVQVCRGKFYAFRGRNVKSPGTYRDTFATVAGCDSIFEVVVNAAPDVYNVTSDTVSSDIPYLWHGQLFMQSGVYRDSFNTAEGCIGVDELRLDYCHVYRTTTTVRICPGESFVYKGADYSKPGKYIDTFKTIYGCDSIVTLLVLLDWHKEYFDTVSFCQGDFIDFHGNRVTSSGDYTHIESSKNGCDSIFHLHAIMNDKSYELTRDTICSDVPYYWYGRALTKSGVYIDSFLTVDGCIGIHELRLVYRRSYDTTVFVRLCPGQSYIYNGIDRSTPGTYVDYLQTLLGCDSMVTTIVTRDYIKQFYDTVAICKYSYYDFFGRKLVNPGDYNQVVNSSLTGCDSIYHIHLDVHDYYYNLQFDTICTNGYYHWRNRILSASGAYYDTVSTTAGCDSIFELRLTVYPENITIVNKTICQGDTFFFNSNPLIATGIYNYTLYNRFGCDSTIKLVLNVLPRITVERNDTICQGDTCLFHGITAWNQGTYMNRVPSPAGCDTLFVLNLFVRPITLTRIDTALCAGDVFFYKGQHFTQSTQIFDTVMVNGGYDITHYNINFKTPVFHHDTFFILKGDSLFYRNVSYTRRGVYYETLKSVEDCDSMTYVLHLDYIPYQKHLYLDICDNEPVWVYSRFYTTSTVDTFTLYSSSETVADTLFFVNVTAYPHKETIIYDTVCNGGAYRFIHGQVLTTSGVYFDTLQTQHGCDSIISLHLAVLDSIVTHDNVTICENESYNWTGPNRVITVPGHYFDSVPNNLCKCYKYYYLDLATVRETKVQIANGSVNSVSVCHDDDSYTIWPTFTGPTPSRYSITYDGVKATHANDVVGGSYDGVSIVLPVPTDQNLAKVRPDVYPVTLSVGNEYCDVSPYTVSFDLHVNYDSTTIRQHFNNVVSVRNANYNGGYTFSGYMWFVNGNVVIDANESNLYLTSLVPGDIVYAMLRRRNETEFIPTCPITIQPYSDLKPYPTLNGTLLLPGSAAVLNSPEAGTYSLCDMKGVLISSGKVNEGETDIAMPYVSGCYILTVSTASHSHTFKVAVR